jgi:hypothetical protein
MIFFKKMTSNSDQIKHKIGEICSNLIHPWAFDEITSCMDERKDDEDEIVNLSYS